MNLAEFKAWFEGYTEGIDKQPTQKQWARIKERMAEVKAPAMTWYPNGGGYWTSSSVIGANTVAQSSLMSQTAGALDGLRDAGRAEAFNG